MRNQLPRVLAIGFLLTLIAACGSGSGRVAVIDLAATAKATGADRVMEEELAAARADLAGQVTRIADNLGRQLEEEQKRLGGSAAAEKQRDFQSLAAELRQQLLQSQSIAQQKANEFQLKLAARYRNAVEPVAAEIAKDRGADLLLVADASVLWVDADIDITDEVIAALREKPIDLAGPKPAAAAAPPAGRQPTKD